jgi:hypothetical protein
MTFALDRGRRGRTEGSQRKEDEPAQAANEDDDSVLPGVLPVLARSLEVPVAHCVVVRFKGGSQRRQQWEENGKDGKRGKGKTHVLGAGKCAL